MILIEAQSTWTMNILVRVLLYLAQSYHEYFQRTSQNYYKSKKVKVPKPELYVIFTGSKGRKPDKIFMSKEFFEGAIFPLCSIRKAFSFATSYRSLLINDFIICSSSNKLIIIVTTSFSLPSKYSIRTFLSLHMRIVSD